MSFSPESTESRAEHEALDVVKPTGGAEAQCGPLVLADSPSPRILLFEAR